MITSISVTASSELTTLSVANADLSDVNVQALGLESLDVHTNNLGTGVLKVGSFSYSNKTWSSGDYRKGNSDSLLICAYGNGISWFGENKSYNATNVSWSCRIGANIPKDTKLSSHQIAYEGHWGDGPSYSGGMSSPVTKTPLSGSNYQGSWTDPDLGSSWCGAKYVTSNEDGWLEGQMASFYTKQGNGTWSGGSRLTVYPFGI